MYMLKGNAKSSASNVKPCIIDKVQKHWLSTLMRSLIDWTPVQHLHSVLTWLNPLVSWSPAQLLSQFWLFLLHIKPDQDLGNSAMIKNEKNGLHFSHFVCMWSIHGGRPQFKEKIIFTETTHVDKWQVKWIMHICWLWLMNLKSYVFADQENFIQHDCHTYPWSICLACLGYWIFNLYYAELNLLG